MGFPSHIDIFIPTKYSSEFLPPDFANSHPYLERKRMLQIVKCVTEQTQRKIRNLPYLLNFCSFSVYFSERWMGVPRNPVDTGKSREWPSFIATMATITMETDHSGGEPKLN